MTGTKDEITLKHLKSKDWFAKNVLDILKKFLPVLTLEL
jgi:hypothetical protein